HLPINLCKIDCVFNPLSGLYVVNGRLDIIQLIAMRNQLSDGQHAVRHKFDDLTELAYALTGCSRYDQLPVMDQVGVESRKIRAAWDATKKVYPPVDCG